MYHCMLVGLIIIRRLALLGGNAIFAGAVAVAVNKGVLWWKYDSCLFAQNLGTFQWLLCGLHASHILIREMISEAEYTPCIHWFGDA